MPICASRKRRSHESRLRRPVSDDTGQTTCCSHSSNPSDYAASPRRNVPDSRNPHIRRGIIRTSALRVLCRYRHNGHWTGHKSRLDRDLRHRFGERAYAAEELVAELGLERAVAITESGRDFAMSLAPASSQIAASPRRDRGDAGKGRRRSVCRSRLNETSLTRPSRSPTVRNELLQLPHANFVAMIHHPSHRVSSAAPSYSLSGVFCVVIDIGW